MEELEVKRSVSRINAFAVELFGLFAIGFWGKDGNSWNLESWSAL